MCLSAVCLPGFRLRGFIPRRCSPNAMRRSSLFFIDVGIDRNANQFMCNRIDRTKYIETLSSGRCLNKDACQAPKKAQSSPIHYLNTRYLYHPKNGG